MNDYNGRPLWNTISMKFSFEFFLPTSRIFRSNFSSTSALKCLINHVQFADEENRIWATFFLNNISRIFLSSEICLRVPKRKIVLQIQMKSETVKVLRMFYIDYNIFIFLTILQ